MFAQLLLCASPGTMDSLLQPKVQARLGNWSPEKEPLPELLTLVSSKLKPMKARGQLSEKTVCAHVRARARNIVFGQRVQ